MNSQVHQIIEKVLVVDDTAQNLILIKQTLKNENIELHTATSGHEALEILKQQYFSLIIIDIQMPILSGPETVKLFKEKGYTHDTPVIFITSELNSKVNIDNIFQLGVYDYIIRPIDISLFKNKVKTFLRLYRSEQNLKKANALLEAKTKNLDQELNQQLRINDDLRFTETVFENSINGIIVLDKDLKFIRANKAFTEITGYPLKDLIGHSPKILSSGLQDKGFYEEMWNTLNRVGAWQGELWNKRKDNELYAEMLSINAVKDTNNIVANYIGIVSDITQKKQDHEKNEHLANYDYLTGLPNRLYLTKTLNNHINNHTDKSLALFFLDLDKFKPVNDTYGHQAGDDLLIAVSKRIKRCLRPQDLVTRLGGDEFVLLIKEPNTSVAACHKIATKIILTLSTPFNISHQSISINTSIGIAVFPQHSKEADTLMTLADNAMYTSKTKGPGHFSYCDQSL